MVRASSVCLPSGSEVEAVLASGRTRRSAAGCEVMSALDIENQRIIDEAIAQNAATSPRTWNGPLPGQRRSTTCGDDR